VLTPLINTFAQSTGWTPRGRFGCPSTASTGSPACHPVLVLPDHDHQENRPLNAWPSITDVAPSPVIARSVTPEAKTRDISSRPPLSRGRPSLPSSSGYSAGIGLSALAA